MKFESIKLHNFMRYKGETEIRFSCNNTKNVRSIIYPCIQKLGGIANLRARTTSTPHPQ